MSGSARLAQAAGNGRWQAWLMLALCLPVAGWVLWQAQRTVRADWVSWRERMQVLAWSAGESKPPSLEAVAAAQAAIQRAVHITPDDPALLERLGDTHLVLALQQWADTPARQASLAQAAAQYQAALQLRPTEAQTWAMLATAWQGMGRPAAEVHGAWAKAQGLGPYEGHVRPVLLRLVLADWDNATPAMQAWAGRLFDEGDAATRKAINAMAAPYGLGFAADGPASP